MSLRCLKKEVRDGVHILHANKHQSLYKLALLFLMEVARHAQNITVPYLGNFLSHYTGLGSQKNEPEKSM